MDTAARVRIELDPNAPFEATRACTVFDEGI